MNTPRDRALDKVARLHYELGRLSYHDKNFMSKKKYLEKELRGLEYYFVKRYEYVASL